MQRIGQNIYEGTDATLNAAAGDWALICCGNGAALEAGSIMFVTKLAIGTTVAGLIAGAAAGSFWTVYSQSTAKDLADGVTANLPAAFTVEALLTQAFQAYDWTGTANNWTVVDARLAESLLIYGKLS